MSGGTPFKGILYALPVSIVLWAIIGGAVWMIWSN